MSTQASAESTSHTYNPTYHSSLKIQPCASRREIETFNTHYSNPLDEHSSPPQGHQNPSYVNQAQRPGCDAVHPGQFQQLQLCHIVIMKIQRGLEVGSCPSSLLAHFFGEVTTVPILVTQK